MLLQAKRLAHQAANPIALDGIADAARGDR
jgi:hypothetical protein